MAALSPLRLFSRRWLLTTLLVVVAVGVMVRLGIWQLDRLEQRRAFNARVSAQLGAGPLVLTGDNLGLDLVNMEYRTVTVSGEYDHSQQVALRNQARDQRWGVNLLTPLRIAGSDQVVLVDRGWIPAEDFTSGQWEKYDEPGRVTVTGMVRRSQERPDFGRRADPTPAPGEFLTAWNLANVGSIDQQISYALLPVYIQQAPNPEWTGMPLRGQPKLELTEGSHMGYAIQWFAFAALLGIGYPFFVRKQEGTPL
jgi:surfeit locus 1 family protein